MKRSVDQNQFADLGVIPVGWGEGPVFLAGHQLGLRTPTSPGGLAHPVRKPGSRRCDSHPVQVTLSRGTSRGILTNVQPRATPILKLRSVPTSPQPPAASPCSRGAAFCRHNLAFPEGHVQRIPQCGVLGAWVPVGMPPRGFLDVSGQPPFFLENLGRQECGRLPGDNGPLSCRVAAGPQTIGLGQALSCCPWPETDAQEAPCERPGADLLGCPVTPRKSPRAGGRRTMGPHARRRVSGMG